MCRQWAKILWLGLLMYKASLSEVLASDRDLVSSVAPSSPAAVRRRAADSLPDVVLKGIIVVKLETVSYMRELEYRKRNLTKRFVLLCEREMSKLFDSVKGKQTVKIESFRRGRRNKLIVVMDLDSTGNENVREISEIIEKKIKIPGKFAHYGVNKRMVMFQAHGVCCQPKVHYSFDVQGRDDKVYDDSGYDNNGETNGEIHVANKGKCGKAVKFKNSYVYLRNFKQAQRPGTDSITIMFWIKLLTPRSNSSILRSYFDGAVTEVALEDGFVKWRYITSHERTAFLMRYEKPLRLGYWTHIACIYDPYQRTVKIYIDTKLSSQGTVPKGLVNWRFTSQLRFGLTSSEGYLDDLYVYDCVLGEDVIKDIKQKCWCEERCAPRGKNEFLIRMKLVSTNNSRQSTDKIADNVRNEIKEMFDDTTGAQRVQTIDYRPVDVDAIMVDYSLESIGNSNTRYLSGVLQPAITSGRFGDVQLASNDVTFAPISGKDVCRSSEMKCNDGECINKLWKCDGEINCADGSDEINCGNTIDMDCNKEEYRCSKSKILGISECVRNNYRCDGQLDCEDDSDEQGCVAPRLITAPRSLMILADGETATCSCVAYGVPAPQVTWHYKGRKVVSKEGKILVSSVSGRGSLTVFNLTPADSGDYICKVRDNRVKKVIAPSCTIKVRAFGKVCGPPFFNKVAQRSSECLRCFCHARTVNCKSARLYKLKLSSDWDCSKCKDDMPRLVDENGQTVSLLDPKIPRTASYYWELPRKYVGNKLTSYGGLLTFIRDSKLIQSWPSRLKRNVLLNKNRSEPTIANYVTEINYQTFWSNDPPSTHNVNNVPKIKPRSYNKDVFNVQDTLSRPQVLNLTGEYVAVIVGTDGTHLVSKKPLDFNKSLTEIKMTEDSWKENRNGITATRQTFLRVLTNIRYIFINARSSGAFVSRPISISLDTATEELNGNEEVVSVEHCACPQGYEGLSCQNCAMGYYRSKLTNECVKCFCFNHSNVCDPTTGKCQNCDHDTEGSNCQNCKPGYYGNATIGTTSDCKLCQCPLDAKTNQFSELCFLDSDGHSTCSECQIGYAGRNCERCAQGYKGNPLEVGGSCYKVGNFSECNMSGSVSQTITTNGKIKCTCKDNVMGSVCNECRPGRFNLQASNPSGCEKCFCNSASRTCSSLVGTMKKIKATFTNERFMLTTLYGTQALPHSVEEANGEMFLRKVFPERHDVRKALYWNLPIKFTGSKVASYGGYLEYTATHSWNETKKLPRTYDVLLMGKKFGIMYVGRHLTKTAYLNNKPQTFRVPLHEKFWQFSSRSLVLKSLFVLFLGKIERLLILATPTAQMKETRLHEVKMDIAVENTKDSKKIFHGIERCSCPLGYTGYSCETCVTGFTRSGSGIVTGCAKCNCNGHSSYCDRETGECKDCQHNTGGKYCEKCIPGFYGDATSGSEAACRPCACPFTNPPNQFSPTCYLGDDGLPVCDQCPEGHEGKRCERCKESYTGNPEIIGDSCKPVTSCGCNTGGSRTKECDEKTKKCECKRYVQGEKCNECKRGFYNLHGSNDEGCNKCFCMGLNTACKSATNFRDQITFIPYSLGLPAGLSITTEDLSQNVSDFVVDFHDKRVRFLNRTWLQRPNIYWTLPRTFLGNQVMSYGGTLSLSYSFYSSQDITYDGNGRIVKIKGNGITLNYRGIRRVPSNKEKDLNIIFLEKHWDNQDGSAVSRFDLMRVLVHIDAIMIRASYGKHTIESSIGQIKMNIPTGEKLGQTKASEVEICECPGNYYGSSCEMCAPGYTRMGNAMGLCVPCQCYSHSNECDERTGVCKNCKHNTAGDNCELCARGFYGNTKTGKTKGCKQCPCPLPGSTNRFSETCFIDSDGLPTCDSCQEGYSGRHCEKCSLNYTGNPLTPGGKCFKVLVELIPTVKISPERIRLQEGDSARFVCTVKSIRPTQILWSRKDGIPLSSKAIVSGNILSFTSLNKSDAGTYVCAANNDIALRLATTELYVKKQQVTAVIVTVTPKSRYIPVGGTAKFSCTSKTSSRHSITWTRENNNPMSSTTYVDRDGTLIVNDAKLGDGGTYVCTGKNTLNIDRAIVSLHVGVVVKPQVAVTPQKQIVDIAQAVKFRCSASAGFPAATLRWKRGDGRQLPRFSKFFRRSGLFKILAASRRDEGEYMCTASNSGGDSVMKVQLLVKGPNSLPRARVTPESLTVDEGNRALLRCDISGDEKLVVRWRKKDGKLPKSAVVRRNDLEIQKTTFYNAGLYICTVTNRYGRAEAQARLNVNEDTLKPSRVSIKPGGTVITAMEGESLTLECQVAGITKPLVRWTHLLKKEVVGYKRKLDFKKLKLDDTGTYVCSSRTEEGEEASVSVVVQRNRILPQVQVRPNNVAANTGEKVTFTCTTRSAQQPVEVAWSRADGTALSKAHLVRGNVLEIHNIRKEHQGTYICLARNRFGASKATAELTVFEP